MPFTRTAALLLSGATLLLTGTAFARADNAAVERVAADKLLVSWQARGPVDVYVSDRPDATVASAKLVSAKDDDGRAEIAAEGAARPYVLLRDAKDKSVVRVAERILPLQQGSNFRDVGGYQTTDGKAVRWGMIYRSGASAMLSDADLAQVKALGLRNMVDLRSDEERTLAPTKIDGVPYTAVGYSMSGLIANMGKGQQNGGHLYRNFPVMLAPQLRLVFGMLKRQEGPIEYNCSAGQDRTGFVTAMILSALGVPRETILRDYDLSTRYRQPKWEMPHIDVARYPDNPVAQLFARFQDDPRAATPQPLREADGTPFLASAFDEIDTKWGSVDAYLEKEVGVTKVDLAALRRTYLE
ncbi:MAG: tyrosine-protein phosphatase [Sphingobium sp.]